MFAQLNEFVADAKGAAAVLQGSAPGASEPPAAPQELDDPAPASSGESNT